MTACVVTHPDIGVHERLYIDLYASGMTFDPTGSTVALWLNGTSVSMSWAGVPILAADGTWSQYARTNAMFSGTALLPPDPADVALAAGRYIGTPVITLIGGQQVDIPPTPIDIR